MKPIGGYFELELGQGKALPFAPDAILLNSGRKALEYILLANKNIANVYVPYYTCSAVLEQLEKNRIPHTFYKINTNLELEENIQLNRNEYLIANNYFGIKDTYIQSLADKYKKQLIIDNAQALYAKHIAGTMSFYSPRKYVGIPDGGLAYCTMVPDIAIEQDYSYDRCAHLLKRIDIDSQSGYADFKAVSKQLSMQPVRHMSHLTQAILSAIDFSTIKRKRKNNFDILHKALKNSNAITIPTADSFECPMVYPYLTTDKHLRERLIQNNIFVATYWPDLSRWCYNEPSQVHLAEQIIPLPIDQRYTKEEMNIIIQIINE